jgi:hypothetical protein
LGSLEKSIPELRMAFEAACASCGGRMMVEHPGNIIACPHCGEQLKSPEDDSAKIISEESASEVPSDSEPDETLALDSADSAPSFPGLPEASAGLENTSLDDAPTEDPSWPTQELPLDEESVFSVDESPTEEPPTEISVTPIETDSEPAEHGTGDELLQNSAMNSAVGDRTVARSKYVLTASYASAVTIGFVFYLWMTLGKANPHQLESLPDVVPKEKATGEIELLVVSESAAMPKGHSLRLGQSQRFGDLMVTPFKVTREPLEFVPHAGDFTQRKPPTGPVLKLWLRFENVSEDQEFMPLGADLLFYRGPTERYPEKMRANNFVCRVDEKHEAGDHVLMYDHVIEDVWDLKGQKLEQGLKPGDNLKTYLPSAEKGIDELKGQLIWRVHLRKGINSKSGWGVTTLIEVEFHSDDIEEKAVDPEVR